nr:hypothetical protein [Tanacetum cinerariifolium]
MDQNIYFSGSDQIQTPQYPEIHPPSQEIRDEVFQAKGDLMKSIQTFLEEFNYIPFEEKPKILLQAWEIFFAIPHAQPEDSNELFQKLLKDLKELAEYVNSPSRDHSSFFNDNEEHSIQNKEYLENSSNEIATSNSNQEKEEPSQDFNIRQLVREECCIEVCEEQKQNMENTILELVEICCQKELFCMHDNVDDLIESALNSKLLSINLNSQRLDKKKQEVKNVMDECKVTSEDESTCDMPIQDQSSSVFMIFPNPLFKDNDDLTSSDDESLFKEDDLPNEESKVYLNPLFNDDEINSNELESHVESKFVESLSNHDALIDSSQKIDYLEEFSGKLTHINTEITEFDFDFEEEIRLIENLLYDNSSPRPPEELNAKIADTIIESLPLLPTPVQDGDSQREEIDIVTETDDVLPLSVENDDDLEEDIHFLKELLSDNSIPLTEDESSDSDHQDDPSFSRPPLEPPDVEFDSEPDAREEISLVMKNIDELNEDECFDPGGEIDVSTNDEDVNYFPFIFVI